MSYKRKSPQPVAEGGTSVSTMTTAYAPVCAGTTATGALQVASTGLSTSGFVLTSNGSSALPSFQASSAGSITINGDSGSASGSTITLTGSTSGAVFTGSGSTVTESFNYLALPTTTSTNGIVKINNISFMHAYGTENTFLGSGAGNFTLTNTDNTGLGFNVLANLSTGTHNTGVGSQCMKNGTVTGTDNTAVGHGSMIALTSGTYNTAIGVGSLATMTSDTSNVALGYQALQSLNGSSNGDNVAVGQNSLQHLATGNFNVAIGASSGTNYNGAESSNVIINNYSTHVTGESNVLRIGDATGTGALQLNKAYISGINGITVTGTAVLVSSSDQLGIAVSSARFKDNIEDMNDVSSGILKLRPVTFNYTIGEDHSMQTGLIAEEVDKVMPSLVVYDKENLPQTVKYHDLPALLLNELQKAVKRIEQLEAKLK